FLMQEEKKLEDLKLRNRMLEIKIANLSSLERIESISKAELGLTRAKEYRVVYLKSEKITRVASIPQTEAVKQNMFAKIFRKVERVAEAEEL
ncbi:hypothetical protein KKC59_01115, partial [bacterium]|nr:hypothetical protein [bacterium]